MNGKYVVVKYKGVKFNVFIVCTPETSLEELQKRAMCKIECLLRDFEMNLASCDQCIHYELIIYHEKTEDFCSQINYVLPKSLSNAQRCNSYEFEKEK